MLFHFCNAKSLRWCSIAFAYGVLQSCSKPYGVYRVFQSIAKPFGVNHIKYMESFRATVNISPKGVVKQVEYMAAFFRAVIYHKECIASFKAVVYHKE